MPRVIIGFQTSTGFKTRVINAGKEYKIDGVPYPMKLSTFCRVAVEKFLLDIMKKETEERSE